jgi:hypothetical protein
MAERELPAFFAAVETLFGRDQAILSAEDWLDEIEQVLARIRRAAAIGARSRLLRLRGRRTDWLLRLGRQAMLITTHSAAQSGLKSQQIRHARSETEPSRTRQNSTKIPDSWCCFRDNPTGFFPSNGKSRKAEIGISPKSLGLKTLSMAFSLHLTQPNLGTEHDVEN